MPSLFSQFTGWRGVVVSAVNRPCLAQHSGLLNGCCSSQLSDLLVDTLRRSALSAPQLQRGPGDQRPARLFFVEPLRSRSAEQRGARIRRTVLLERALRRRNVHVQRPRFLGLSALRTVPQPDGIRWVPVLGARIPSARQRLRPVPRRFESERTVRFQLRRSGLLPCQLHARRAAGRRLPQQQSASAVAVGRRKSSRRCGPRRRVWPAADAVVIAG